MAGEGRFGFVETVDWGRGGFAPFVEIFCGGAMQGYIKARMFFWNRAMYCSSAHLPFNCTPSPSTSSFHEGVHHASLARPLLHLFMQHSLRLVFFANIMQTEDVVSDILCGNFDNGGMLKATPSRGGLQPVVLQKRISSSRRPPKRLFSRNGDHRPGGLQFDRGTGAPPVRGGAGEVVC